MKTIVAICGVALLAAACSAPAPSSSASAGAGFSIDDLVEIKHPSAPVWSPDGTRLLFAWDRAGITNLYLSDVTGSAPTPLTAEADGIGGTPFWSRDGQRVFFARRGDLWAVPVVGGQPAPVWTTPAPESDIVLSPDGTRVAFVRPHEGRPGSSLFVRVLDSGAETRVAADERSVGGPVWSPDGSRLAFSAGAHAIRHEQTPEYSGAKIIYTVTERVQGQGFIVPAAGGRAVRVGGPAGGGLRWLGNDQVIFDRQSPDYKRRTTYLADARTGEARMLREDVDAKFWSIPGNTGAAAQGSPDGKWIAFLSDRDGWDHLYVMAAAGGEAVQVTSGAFEAWRPTWSPDSTRLAFDANLPGQPGTRHVGIATVSGSGTPQVTVVTRTAGRGTNIAPEWSPDGSRLVYQHTDPANPADLYVVGASSGEPVRVSDSLPAAIDRARLVEPEFVTYPGPDGQSVPGWLFVPKGLDRSRKHPAIVWIHGDGVNQNYDGWHVQRNYAVYYSFHQYLMQQGYVVFAPDYRGSIGYGRDWRQGVYMDVGGRDAQDAWMSANYLKTLPYVDGDRMGVWGLSYGGFFTMIAVTDQPNLFAAGVNVAGVVDYAMYYEDPYHGSGTCLLPAKIS
jgi:dipeptidyl aminopeptidase/acylaminoacyl peptidase